VLVLTVFGLIAVQKINDEAEAVLATDDDDVIVVDELDVGDDDPAALTAADDGGGDGGGDDGAHIPMVPPERRGVSAGALPLGGAGATREWRPWAGHRRRHVSEGQDGSHRRG